MLCLVEIQHKDQLKEKSRSSRKQIRKAPCYTKCGELMKRIKKACVNEIWLLNNKIFSN